MAVKLFFGIYIIGLGGKIPYINLPLPEGKLKITS